MKSKTTKSVAGSTSPGADRTAARHRATFRQLFERCQSRRDRECLCRVFKEVAIIGQDFDLATAYREIQKTFLPRVRRNNSQPDGLR